MPVKKTDKKKPKKPVSIKSNYQKQNVKVIVNSKESAGKTNYVGGYPPLQHTTMYVPQNNTGLTKTDLEDIIIRTRYANNPYDSIYNNPPYIHNRPTLTTNKSPNKVDIKPVLTTGKSSTYIDIKPKPEPVRPIYNTPVKPEPVRPILSTNSSSMFIPPIDTKYTPIDRAISRYESPIEAKEPETIFPPLRIGNQPFVNPNIGRPRKAYIDQDKKDKQIKDAARYKADKFLKQKQQKQQKKFIEALKNIKK